MLAFVAIVRIYLKKIQYSLSEQGEACRDKIDAGKTPRSVRLRRVQLRAVLATS